MARRRRNSFPGAMYHVMLRGNNGQNIFTSDEERCTFCLLLQQGTERYGHRILAFCFMSNHVHLAIQLSDVPLSKICQNLAFRYTRFYNWRHKTIGHLFQGRFKSIMVDSRLYLKELIRYIHLNPVRAYLTENPLDYKWSSHQAYLMKQEYTWLARDEGLRLFGDFQQEAAIQFEQFVLSGIGQSDEIDFKRGMAQGIVGDDVFIKQVEQANLDSVVKPLTMDLKSLVSVVTNWYGVSSEILLTPGIERKPAHIRAVIAFLARNIKGVSLRELADFCGRADNSMSQAATRLEVRMRNNDELVTEIENLKKALLLSCK